MTTIPDPEYLKTDDGALIAYQVVGHGPVDIAWQLDYIGTSIFGGRPLRRGPGSRDLLRFRG